VIFCSVLKIDYNVLFLIFTLAFHTQLSAFEAPGAVYGFRFNVAIYASRSFLVDVTSVDFISRKPGVIRFINMLGYIIQNS